MALGEQNVGYPTKCLEHCIQDTPTGQAGQLARAVCVGQGGAQGGSSPLFPTLLSLPVLSFGNSAAYNLPWWAPIAAHYSQYYFYVTKIQEDQ